MRIIINVKYIIVIITAIHIAAIMIIIIIILPLTLLPIAGSSGAIQRRSTLSGALLLALGIHYRGVQWDWGSITY